MDHTVLPAITPMSRTWQTCHERDRQTVGETDTARRHRTRCPYSVAQQKFKRLCRLSRVLDSVALSDIIFVANWYRK